MFGKYKRLLQRVTSIEDYFGLAYTEVDTLYGLMRDLLELQKEHENKKVKK